MTKRFDGRRAITAHGLAAGLAVVGLLAASLPAAAEGPYWLRHSDLHVPRPVEKSAAVPAPRPVEPSAVPAPPPGRSTTAPGTPPTTVPTTTPPQQPQSRPDDGTAIEIGGSYRALAIDGRTSAPAGEPTTPYTQWAHRLRLKLAWRPEPRWLLRLEHDSELTAGSYLRTAQARSDEPVRQYLGDGSTWLRRPGLRGTQGVFRGFVQYSGEGSTLVLGRQRVPLGAGRFWSALDMLNPINPLQVERDEFVGVDALFIERSLGELSRASLAFAPDPARRDHRWVGQYRLHAGETDVTATYGRYWRDDVLGLDIATQLGDVALRGELALVRHGGGQHRKLLVGADYVFPNTLSFSAELFHSTEPLAQRLQRWQANPQLAQVEPYGNAYAGLAVGYELTPLLKASTYLLANLRDGSRLLYPTLSWSLTADSLVSGGAQYFSGAADSEYGRGIRLLFLRFQQFF